MRLKGKEGHLAGNFALSRKSNKKFYCPTLWKKKGRLRSEGGWKKPEKKNYKKKDL